MIFLINNQKAGQSVISLQKMLDISGYKTAWLMAHKIRVAMKRRENEYQLAGLIEIDEMYLGSHQTGKHSRGSKWKSIIVGGIEVKNNKPCRALLKVVKQVSTNELTKVAKEKIKVGSTLKIDGFRSYLGLKKEKYELVTIVIHEP